jgi:hypothetical protein
MNRTSLWRVKAQIVLWRHGWAWPLALFVAVITGAAYWMVLQPARAALVATQAELGREQSASAKTKTVEPPSETQQLTALSAALRASPPPAELVRRMAALAQAEQIALPQGEYQQQVHGSTQVVQVHVTQAVRASYPQLRRYIESVLRTIPNASLDQVAARRENVGQAQLEVRLRWSLWMQPTSAAAPSSAAAADDAARAAK